MTYSTLLRWWIGGFLLNVSQNHRDSPHPLDWLYGSLYSPPVAGVWWAHWRRCPLAAVASSKWMLHTGGGWGETPHMIVKGFGCTTIHKALYKCIINSFTIKRTKDLNYFSLCAFNLFNTQVFVLNYLNELFHNVLIYWDAPLVFIVIF